MIRPWSVSLAFVVLHLRLFAVFTDEDNCNGPKPGARLRAERNGFAHTGKGPATVPVDGTYHIRGLKFQALLDLTEEFSDAIDLEVDRMLYESTTEQFCNLLADYVQHYDSHGINLTSQVEGRVLENDLGLLLQKALLVAFSLRMNSIKDWLSQGKGLSIGSHHRDNIANWSLTLVKEILHYSSSMSKSGNMHSSLRLAVKLQLIEAIEMLLQYGIDAGSKECNSHFINSLQQAVINQHLEGISILIKAHIELNMMIDVHERLALICQCLTREGSDIPLSPWEIADTQCNSGLSCEVAHYLWSVVKTDCRLNTFSEALNIPTASSAGKDRILVTLQQSLSSPPLTCCPSYELHVTHSQNRLAAGCTQEQDTSDGRLKYTWLPRYLADLGPGAQHSGWAVYSNIHIGRELCDLPHISATSLSAEDFKAIFVNLR